MLSQLRQMLAAWQSPQMPVEHQQQPVSGVVLESMHVSAGIFQLEFTGDLTDAAAHSYRSHIRT